MPFGSIIVVIDQDGVDDTGYPKKYGEYNTEYERADATGGENRGWWEQDAKEVTHNNT